MPPGEKAGLSLFAPPPNINVVGQLMLAIGTFYIQFHTLFVHTQVRTDSHVFVIDATARTYGESSVVIEKNIHGSFPWSHDVMVI